MSATGRDSDGDSPGSDGDSSGSDGDSWTGHGSDGDSSIGRDSDDEFIGSAGPYEKYRIPNTTTYHGVSRTIMADGLAYPPWVPRYVKR